MKIVNLETITDMQSWCRTWPLNGSSRIRVKQKLHRKYRESCKSSWSLIGNLKSFTLTIPWNLAKPVKIFPGIIARLHGIAERAVRRVKEGTSAVLLQSGLNESWWADSMDVTPICETSQIYYLMGRRPMKYVLGNHLKDRLFRLVHWLSITLSLRKTSQESINFEKSLAWIVPWIRIVRGWNLEG